MFYDKVIYKTIFESSKNEIGQVVKVLTIDKQFMGDIQPVIRKTQSINYGDTGEFVKGTYYLFTDEAIELGSVLVYEGQTYLVEDLNKCFDFVEAVLTKKTYEVKRWI